MSKATGSEWLSEALSRKARELAYGMDSRVGRLPDAADFRAAFEPILKEQNQRLDRQRELLRRSLPYLQDVFNLVAQMAKYLGGEIQDTLLDEIKDELARE